VQEETQEVPRVEEEKQEPEILDLAALTEYGEKIQLRKGDFVFEIRNPLDLSLEECSITERLARKAQAGITKARQGEANAQLASEAEKSLTEYCAIVSTLPVQDIDELKWWQKLAILGAFQGQRKIATAATPDATQEPQDLMDAPPAKVTLVTR
jgi:hypothetical protein